MAEKALLVGFTTPEGKWHEIDSLEELEQLTKTAGAQVLEKIMQIREKQDPAFLVGKGKVEEIKNLVNKFNIDLVVFNKNLTPSQTKNLIREIGTKVIDRTELILDIFANHARTSEAKIQVELAQLEYRLSKLIGKGHELSRLGGGIGTRGPGEKKLEVDRRKILKRIAFLRKKLQDIELHRATQRKKREGLFKVSLVGYTNSGKTTILNLLTKSNQYVADQLFSTLDTVTRTMYHPKRLKILISDTVGFIESIPPQLIASFKSTLAVVKEADLILHIIDISHPRVCERIEIVEKTLEDLEAIDIPLVRVFNKIDLLLENMTIERLRERYPQSVFISAKTGENIQTLVNIIFENAEKFYGALKRI